MEKIIQKDDINVDDNDLDEQYTDCDILEKLSRIIQRNGYVCSPLNAQNVGTFMKDHSENLLVWSYFCNLKSTSHFFVLFFWIRFFIIDLFFSGHTHFFSANRNHTIYFSMDCFIRLGY